CYFLKSNECREFNYLPDFYLGNHYLFVQFGGSHYHHYDRQKRTSKNDAWLWYESFSNKKHLFPNRLFDYDFIGIIWSFIGKCTWTSTKYLPFGYGQSFCSFSV